MYSEVNGQAMSEARAGEEGGERAMKKRANFYIRDAQPIQNEMGHV